MTGRTAPRIKICGITNADDALLAIDLGADYLGFVFAPSPRRAGVAEAAAIIRALPAGFPRDRAVAVFVNASAAEMECILGETGICTAQIHGDEPPEACASFAFSWYRALRVRAGSDLTALRPEAWACDRLLFDAKVEGQYGGTGQGIAPEVAAAALAAARNAGKSAWIAGGLGAENVAAILERLRPDGIDASSGLEAEPGRKSREKMERFFAAIAEIGNRDGGFHDAP